MNETDVPESTDEPESTNYHSGDKISIFTILFPSSNTKQLSLPVTINEKVATIFIAYLENLLSISIDYIMINNMIIDEMKHFTHTFTSMDNLYISEQNKQKTRSFLSHPNMSNASFQFNLQNSSLQSLFNSDNLFSNNVLSSLNNQLSQISVLPTNSEFNININNSSSSNILQSLLSSSSNFTQNLPNNTTNIPEIDPTNTPVSSEIYDVYEEVNTDEEIEVDFDLDNEEDYQEDYQDDNLDNDDVFMVSPSMEVSFDNIIEQQDGEYSSIIVPTNISISLSNNSDSPPELPPGLPPGLPPRDSPPPESPLESPPPESPPELPPRDSLPSQEVTDEFPNYELQVNQLNLMGFSNTETVRNILELTNGNVEMALSYLI